MKKFTLGLVAALCLVGISGCKKTEEVDKSINIQLVPSFTVDASAFAKVAKIQAALEAAMPEDYSISVSIGTSYNAVIEAMAAGTCDVGFLTAQQFAYAAVEMPGEIDVILSAVRTAYQVQIDFPGDLEAQVAAMNGANGYEYRGQQSTTPTTNYSAILMTKADSGINSLADLKGKTVGVGGTTSGSGYIYPTLTMREAGLNFVTSGTPNAANNEVLLQTVSGSHPGAFLAVMNEDVDAAWAYLDVRYSNFYNKSDSGYYQDATVFTNYKVVAQSTPIYNDTVSVRADLDATTRGLLATAFKGLKDTEDGLSGISVYSHTGYADAETADYDGEKQVYIYKRDVLSN